VDQWLESLVPWGVDAVVWVQSLSTPWLNTLFKALTFLGNEEFYLLLLPFVYWCLGRRAGVALGFLSMLSAWSNSLVKYIFRIPRPAIFDSRVHPLVEDIRPSFASGHAQGAVVNWGYLAYQFRKPAFWVVAILLILGIGISRLVMGVHFPQDILGGWLLGLILLVVYARLEPPISSWIARQGTTVQVILAVGVPLLLIFLHPADVEGLYPADDAITPLASLAGFGVGLIMERRWVRFRVAGEWWRRGLRFLVGVIVVGLFYAGPAQFLPDEMAHGLEAAIRFVRYALTGWAGSFLGPWLFVRLNLAERE
jgi:membrane-associated phospholipid phosphatase